MLKHPYKKQILAAFLALGTLLVPNHSEAKRLNIIFIPLDNRPVCNDYVKQTMEAADVKLITPPDKLIASNLTNGDPDKIWEWLQNKAPKADAAVISTDSLIYGGLVASRTHHYTAQQLEDRIDHLYELKSSLPIKIYAFSTIMRTPRASKGRVEPPYYANVGPSIFAYSQLLDKSTNKTLTPAEQLKMAALERNLKKEELGDWLERRQKNYDVNKQLSHLARNGRFHYLAVGKDDNATLSATHKEARELHQATFDMSADDFQIIDGVDQLGLLLAMRAYNEAHNVQPSVYPLYSAGVGAGTLPQYSDARLQDSVPQQIIAAGATISSSPATADLILALNTPQDGIVKDSTADDNQAFASVANKNFTNQINQHLNANRLVSLADISYSNGADNGFMDYFANNSDFSRLAAYNGWNTADNAIGYAIAQGLAAPSMKKQDREQIMRVRLFDDWFYQSNTRRAISRELENANREEMKYDLGGSEKAVLTQATVLTQTMARKYKFTQNSKFNFTFPWKRLFEVDMEIKKEK